MIEYDIKTIQSQAASFVIINFVHKRPKLSDKFLIQPIFRPLLIYSRNSKNVDLGNDADEKGKEIYENFDLDGNPIISTETEISNCLSCLQKLLIGNEPSQALIDRISKGILN